MLDAETVVQVPHSDTDGRVSVSMKTRGCELILLFDDLSGEGPLRELRLLPDTSSLEPAVLREIATQAPLFAAYARAVIQWRRDDAHAAALSLRHVGATRRGLGEDFYKIVAANYNALVAEGERHPVKALSKLHHVSISAASRWIKQARQRGLIKDEDDA